MRNRLVHTQWILGLCLGWTIQQPAAALSLAQEALTHTAIGQPLRAEIAINAFSEAELDSLQVDLAPSQEYANLGLDYATLAKQLQFTIERRNGAALIAIMSQSGMRDPALPLMLDIQWSGGHLMREYPVVLDMPQFQVVERSVATAAQTPAPIRVAEPIAVVDAVVNNTKTAAPAVAHVAQAPTQTQNVVKPSSNRYGPVKGGETLSEIAMRVRPDPALSLPQVILALYERNPEAFIDNDIHQLQKGVSLALPEIDIYRATSRAEARVALEDILDGADSATPRTAHTLIIGPLKEGSMVAENTPTNAPGDSKNATIDATRKHLDDANALTAQLRRENEALQNKILALQQQSQTLLQQLAARGVDIPNAPTTAPTASVAAMNTSALPVNNAAKPAPASTTTTTKVAARRITPVPGNGPDGTLIVLLAAVVTSAAGLAQVMTDENRQKVSDWFNGLLRKSHAST